jgi:lipid A 3-O-deacylase
LTFCCCVGIISSAQAQEEGASSRSSYDYAFVGTIDDDSSNLAGPGSDQAYTGGYRYSFVFTKDKTPWWASVDENLTPIHQRTFGIAISQELFTPDDIYSSNFLPNDRPYAAWFFLGLSSSYQTEFSNSMFEMDIGTVGPDAQGQQLQNGIHEILGDRFANGWANQLYSEPTLQFFYQRRFSSLGGSVSIETPKRFDFIPYYSIAVGNVYDVASVGGYLRWGLGDLPNDFGPSRPTSKSGDGYARLQGRAPSSDLYFFGGLEGSFVARNMFLDGNTFRPSPRVTKYPLVAQSDFGVGKQFRRWSLEWHFVTDSPEFVEKSAFNSYSSVTLTIVY